MIIFLVNNIHYALSSHFINFVEEFSSDENLPKMFTAEVSVSFPGAVSGVLVCVCVVLLCIFQCHTSRNLKI